MTMEYVSLEVHNEFVKRIEAEDNRQNKRIEIINGSGNPIIMEIVDHRPEPNEE